MENGKINKPIFFEKGHKYLNDLTGQTYISVTTLLHTLEPKKDWDNIVKKYVKSRDDLQLVKDIVAKYDISSDELIHKFKEIGKEETVKWIWKQKNLKACEKGSAEHDKREQKDLSTEIHIVDGKEIPVGIDATRIEDLYTLPDGVYCELLVWNNFLGIAGKADKIIIQTIDGVRYVDVEDYKTNEEIKTYNYIGKDGKKVYNENLLEPVEKYCNCNYWIYQLQLNMYGWLLTQFGFKLRKGRIIHTIDNDKVYPLLNLQSDIENIITHYQNAKRRSDKKVSSEI